MSLVPIGDMATATLSSGGVTGSVTWETTTDFDAAQDRDGVITRAAGAWVDDAIARGYDPDILSDLVLYLPLDEQSGTTATDVSPEGNDATIEGGVSLGEPGPFNRSFGFANDDTERVYVPHDPVYNFTGQSFTVACWVNFNGITEGEKSLVCKYAEGTSITESWMLWVISGGEQVSFRVRDTGGASARANADLFIQTDPHDHTDIWHHVAGTWDAPNDEAKVFINGVEWDAEVNTGIGDFDNTSEVNIGRFFTTQSLEGRISDVQIHDALKSPTTIEALHRTGRNGFLLSDKREI